MSAASPGAEVFLDDEVNNVVTRRQKHRIGVHCHHRGPWTCHRVAERQRRRFHVHARGCVVCGDGPYAWLRDQFESQRPAERALRFWGGERRAVRRHWWTKTPTRQELDAWDVDRAVRS